MKTEIEGNLDAEPDLKQVLEKISVGPIDYREAYFLQGQILEGKLDNSQLASLFRSLERGCSKEELFGFFDASKNSIPAVETGLDTLDIVGTGGDGLHTINISTMAAFVVAAYGQPVTKFGNRAATSSCGAADVLESLGANIEIKAENVVDYLKEDNFVFLFAPFYHKSFKNVREARKEYGKRTYFNTLGPLLNPANPAFRLVGVSDHAQVENMLAILEHSGIKRAWVVTGDDGMDEISISGETPVWEYNAGKISHFKIKPEDYGFKSISNEILKGGRADENAEIMKEILSGQDSSARILAVILNAAAGLVISGRCRSMSEGIKIAQDIIKDGKAMENLNKFIEMGKSNS